MISSIKHTSTYKSLNLNKEHSHAFLLYSSDKELNNQVALNFCCELLCESNNGCGVCTSCKQFNANSHPDVLVINQSAVKVEDANNIIAKLNTMPIYSNIKVFLILNAETINETAQNKLLKSIEEPNEYSVFIFTTTKTDKLLQTVLSRLNKVYVPKLSYEDNIIIAKELKEKNIDIFKYINSDLNLTELLNFVNNENYENTVKSISYLFSNLKTTQDIPSVVTHIANVDKTLFLPLVQELFICCLNNKNKFDASLMQIINNTFSKQALTNCLPLLNKAYKMQIANVNFSYILDNLLFNILKEKFLCR